MADAAYTERVGLLALAGKNMDTYYLLMNTIRGCIMENSSQ